VPIKIRETINYRIGFLRGRSIVEPNQRTAMHALFKDGKVAADELGIEWTLSWP
jgi:hypothetical protein